MAQATAQDRLLVSRIAAGDAEAFAGFYREHLDAVVAYFRRRVATPDAAFDLAAETFAAFVADAGRFAGEGPAVGWLFGIAANKLRESARRGRVEDRARRKLGLEPVVLDDGDLAAVEERAEAGGPALAAALEGLADDVRAAVLARVVDERSYRDIAVELDCSEQVVRQRVHRGLRRLRTQLEEER